MRRMGSALMLMTLAGCGALRDAFSAHERVVASAAGQDFTVEQLATWVAPAQKIQPKVETFAALATIWVDYMVYAAQLAKGTDLEDSLLVYKANWPLVSQVKWDRFHEHLLSTRPRPTVSQVDSAYQAGDIRMFQHILLQVAAGASPSVIEQKRIQMDRVLRDAKRGANFAALARTHSEDPGSKPMGGYLPPSPRGTFVAPFESAAWDLQPGGLSDVVRSPFGFHIIRRPPLDEVRDNYGAGLSQRAMQHFDSIYVDSLSKMRGLKVKEGAPAIVRQVFADVEGARNDTRVLVTYRGGAFRVKDFIRWILAINSEEVKGLPNATDKQLQQFLRVATQREMLLQQVDSAGIQVSPDEWKQIRATYDSSRAILNNQLGISAKMLADSAPTVDARVRLAAVHVNNYMGQLLAGQARFFPVPPFLAMELRAREHWSITPSGIADAVERAKALRGPEDSLRSGGMRPAPGPAPVPMDTARHRTIR